MSIRRTRPQSIPSLALVGGWVALSCAPDTDLLKESARPSAPGQSDPATAAAAALVDPIPGAAAVPLNLAAILVRFPRAVTAAPAMDDRGSAGVAPMPPPHAADHAVEGGAALPLELFTLSSDGGAIRPGWPEAVDCPAGVGGRCFRSALLELLHPSATYVVSLAPGLRDEDGEFIDPGPVGQFVTADRADLQPPGIGSFSVEVSGPCVVARFQTDELASGALLMQGSGWERMISAGAGATQFLVAAGLAAFPPGSDVQVLGRATDLAGNIAETAAVSLTVPAGLLPLAITEVQANPVGAEPAQEYVELRNLGGDPIDTAGAELTIADEKGGDLLPPMILAPRAYALVVPSTFELQGVGDTPPRLGTTLLRVDARIGADGLANGGEIVRLRNGAGTVLSSYGGHVDTSAAKWAGKGVHRSPEEACDQAASWGRIPSAATPGWGAL